MLSPAHRSTQPHHGSVIVDLDAVDCAGTVASTTLVLFDIAPFAATS